MRRIVMGVLLVGLALAGSCQAEVSCGKKKQTVQSVVRPKISEILGAQIDAVECPRSSGKKGDTMVCTSSIDGAPFSIDVSFDADDHIQMNPRGLIRGDKAESFVASQIEQTQHVVAKVDCGPRFRAIVIGESFTCTATVGSETRTARLTMNDDSGNISMTME